MAAAKAIGAPVAGAGTAASIDSRSSIAAAGACRQRVVVTGLGAVSGFGWGVEALWRGLLGGGTAIRTIRRFRHADHRTHLAAEVPAHPGKDSPARARDYRQLSVADRFALAAAVEAVAAAGLDDRLAAGEGEAGVFFGSSTGGMWEAEAYLAGLLAGRRRGGVRLHSLASQQVNGPGDSVARRFGVSGPVQTVSSACSSGALSIGAALAALRAGEVEVALAGGSDSLCQLTYAGFNSLRAVDEAPCRPFRAGRAGMSVGEGAAVVVLEPLARALARGARPLAELAGAAGACDAHHMTAPEPHGTGAAAAMIAALADAGLGPEEIDFLNAHGTGTPLNDAAEWRAMELVFGPRARQLPVMATKAGIGHLLGSSGAIEAVVTVLALWRGELHPVPPAVEPVDADCPAALVTGQPLRLPAARAAVSTSLAFGGSNAALVFRRYESGGA
jgi:3-oxoacyl-(acyl-carrier-protein) synthase